MANSFGIWKVIISADDVNLDKIFQFSPETSLGTVLERWQQHFDVVGDYVLKSDDKTVEYDLELSLEDIGETSQGSKSVLMTVELSAVYTITPTRNIHVIINDRCRHYRVKGSSRLRNIIPNSKGISFQYNGKSIQISKTIRQLGIKEDGVITAMKAIPVNLSEGKQKMLSVPDGSSVSHLKHSLRQLEFEDFFLKSKGRLLRQDELLDSTDMLKACRPEFQVEIDDQTVKFCANGRRIAFQDFIASLADASGISRRELMRRVYVCEGCRRRVEDHEEEVQLLNIDCCRLRSLTLKVEISVHKREKSEDLMASFRRKYSKLLSEFKLLNRAQSEAQCTVSTLKSEKQTLQETTDRLRDHLTDEEVRRENIEANNKRLEEALCRLRDCAKKDCATQYPPPVPPPTRPVRFFLWDKTDARNTGFHYLQLPYPPTVGDLRRCVSELLHLRPEETEIQRKTAVSRVGGKPLLFVAGVGRVAYFSTLDGKDEFRHSEVKDVKSEILLNDEEVVVLPPGHSQHLIINQR